jgi:hypothetical protein
VNVLVSFCKLCQLNACGFCNFMPFVNYYYCLLLKLVNHFWSLEVQVKWDICHWHYSGKFTRVIYVMIFKVIVICTIFDDLKFLTSIPYMTSSKWSRSEPGFKRLIHVDDLGGCTLVLCSCLCKLWPPIGHRCFAVCMYVYRCYMELHIVIMGVSQAFVWHFFCAFMFTSECRCSMF